MFPKILVALAFFASILFSHSASAQVMVHPEYGIVGGQFHTESICNPALKKLCVMVINNTTDAISLGTSDAPVALVTQGRVNGEDITQCVRSRTLGCIPVLLPDQAGYIVFSGEEAMAQIRFTRWTMVDLEPQPLSMVPGSSSPAIFLGSLGLTATRDCSGSFEIPFKQQALRTRFLGGIKCHE